MISKILLLIVLTFISTLNGASECDYSLVYSRLKDRIYSMKSVCGEVCDTDIEAKGKGKFYDYIEKKVDCDALFRIDEYTNEFVIPPMKVPKFLKEHYSYGFRIPISEIHMMDDNYILDESIWSEENVENYRQLLRNGKLFGAYGLDAVENIYDTLKSKFNTTESRALVIGSQSPWIEAILLELGVEDIITLEYTKFKSTHPKIRVLLPDELASMYLSGNFTGFDLVVSFSSLEHSGLGRYGDGLNPWGDLITMSKAWCLTKTNGQALIGVPTGINDEILFNAAKVYGPLQYSHLFSNWEQIYTQSDPLTQYSPECKWCYQPLHVLKKL